ncbi:MAG TPA: MFS transporter [Candidatus Polarisedimenticolaceae bacterium]|nr:MFS transporter [Candidatus Polarisedimenticolaceae bacterium]
MSGALARLNPWRGLGDLPNAIWIHFAATLINRLGTMALPFLVLYLTQERGFDAEHAGLMLGIYGGTSLVVTPIMGKLADRLGHVRMMKASLLGSGLVLMAYPVAATPAQVTVVTVLFAITAEAFRPASLSVLTDLAPPEQRKAAFAANRLAINLGMSVGPAVGGYLAQVSFPTIFRVNGSSTLLAWMLLTVTGFKVVEHTSAGAHAAHGAGSTPGYKNPLLITFLVACVPLAAVFFQHEGALPLDVVRDLGMKESFFGWMFTINTILIVLFEVRLNLTTSHWSHGRSLATGGMFLAAGFGAMAFATTPLSVAATVVVWTIGEMILLPSMSNFVAEIAPADRRGEYMGLYSMSWGIAFAVGPWLGTVVLERFGRVTLWAGCFVAAALAAMALSRLPSPSRASVPAGAEN